MKINGISVNYEDLETQKKSPIVLLHGWNQNIEMMRPFASFFSKNHRVIMIDLPGFGASQVPPFEYSIYDYALLINELLQKLKVTNPIIIGHSFGGKIALLYASIYEVDKLIILASPYRKVLKPSSKKIKILRLLKKVPILKPFEEFAKQRIGTANYRTATPLMRNIFVNYLNFDLSCDLWKIEAQTLLIWGDADEVVSINEGRELSKKIENARLVEIKNATHYAYLENLSYVIKQIYQIIY